MSYGVRGSIARVAAGDKTNRIQHMTYDLNTCNHTHTHSHSHTHYFACFLSCINPSFKLVNEQVTIKI